MREKIKEIIKDSYEKNIRMISWEGMHDIAVDKIIKLIKKSENKAWLIYHFMCILRYTKW